MYFSGRLRQRGDGNIFKAFTRGIIPFVSKHFGKDIKRLAPKAVKKALSLGVGVVRDVTKKKSLKQSISDRGKKIISDAINSSEPPVKRQRLSSVRRVNKTKKGRPKKKETYLINLKGAFCGKKRK